MSIEIDFTKPIKDSSGELLNIEDDESGESIENAKVAIKIPIIDLLNEYTKNEDTLTKLKAIDDLMGDISRDKKEYTKRDVELIEEGVEEGLRNKDKPPVIKLAIARLLEDAKKTIEVDGSVQNNRKN